MTDAPRMGPVALCTLIGGNGAALSQAYTQWLHQQVSGTGILDGESAAALGFRQLEGQQYWLLSNTRGRQWLQIIDYPEAVAQDSLANYGWLAMEVLVEDVDKLAESLADSPFQLLRPAADLDVSDRIRACQARGPFIPVLSTPSRDESLAQYSAISGNEGLSFDTKITVVNQARGFDLDRRHPVATLQLAGKALIEIDQIAETGETTAGIQAGMANVAFYCSASASPGAQLMTEGPLAGHRTESRTGVAGERFTLVYS